jgi:hypothetical protein
MLSGGEFESTGRDYLKTLDVVFAAYDSASHGRVVTGPERQGSRI